jgi:hypothetical protein
MTTFPPLEVWLVTACTVTSLSSGPPPAQQSSGSGGDDGGGDSLGFVPRSE